MAKLPPAAGAYVAGSNPAVDEAIALMPGVRAFLAQKAWESCDYDDAVARLLELLPQEVSSSAI